MKPTALLGAVGLVIFMVSAVAAQPGVGIIVSSPDRLERRPRDERMYPADPSYADRHGVAYAPVFVGPTAKGDTTEMGFSAWIAPNGSTSLQPGGGDVSGWAALGLTFSWGGPPRRPSAGPATP
jgi:hypothetical protein